MSETKSPTLKMVAVLFAFCLVSAAALGYIYGISSERIEENRRALIRDAVLKVIPSIDEFEQLDGDPLIYRGLAGGRLAGYAVPKGGTGFQGEIVLMVGIDARLETITGVEVVETVETPGLGDRIREKEFLNQFRDMNIPPDGKIEVDGITGATMSSDAVRKIIEKSIKSAEKRIH